MDLKEALIALNMIEGIGPIRLSRLIRRFGDASSVLSASQQELITVDGIGEDVARSVNQWENNIDLSGELNRIRDYGCGILTSEDERYPDYLRHISDPPIVLYVRGNILETDHRGIAMVGSRLTTHYGRETARKLAGSLARSDITVVSGGARGIDTEAHQGALESGGRTIAVLGTGINRVYPAENIKLFEEIAQSGAVMTQFPFNRPGDRQSFPIRNRIVAGMTIGTVVVEANRTSGALITANMAADYGRQVFAVPGRIDSSRSKGCHELIKNGAKLCESSEDILTEFDYLFPNAIPEEPKNDSNVLNPDSLSGLSDIEKEILKVLSHHGSEMQIDQLITTGGFRSAEVSAALLKLELRKQVKQLSGKRFTL